MRTISKSQLADSIIILASLLMISGAAWTVWQNSSVTGLFVGTIGAGLGLVGALLKRNQQQCPEHAEEE
jgi:hypothetical protein